MEDIMFNFIFTVYLTGLIVCLIYDISLYLVGDKIWVGWNIFQIILDEVFWFIGAPLALFIAIKFRDKIKEKEGWTSVKESIPIDHKDRIIKLSDGTKEDAFFKVSENKWCYETMVPVIIPSEGDTRTVDYWKNK